MPVTTSPFSSSNDEGSWVTFYPELEEGQELASLLGRELQRERPSTPIQESYHINRVSRHWVNYELSDRLASVALASEKRLFMVDFWDKGVRTGAAHTANLREAAEAIYAFLAERLSTADLHQRFPFFTIGEQAPAHELGAAAEVAWQWGNVMEHIADSIRELLPLANLIRTRPPFNQLFPYISLEALCFSRCTGQPFSSDCPVAVALSLGDYEVRNNRGKPFGRGDEGTALNLLIEHLPPNCGPAVQGTANDLDSPRP